MSMADYVDPSDYDTVPRHGRDCACTYFTDDGACDECGRYPDDVCRDCGRPGPLHPNGVCTDCNIERYL